MRSGAAQRDVTCSFMARAYVFAVKRGSRGLPNGENLGRNACVLVGALFGIARVPVGVIERWSDARIKGSRCGATLF
jgi:hypothetical protein